MKIWVDADACPKAVKEILYKAANREQIVITFISNLYLKIPQSQYLQAIQVPGGFDVADEHIAKMAVADDLVITSDIPLAAKIVETGAIALSAYGKLFTVENIRDALNMRNLKEELRTTGLDTGGPSAFSMKDRELFANQLDRIIKSKL